MKKDWIGKTNVLIVHRIIGGLKVYAVMIATCAIATGLETKLLTLEEMNIECPSCLVMFNALKTEGFFSGWG